MREEVVCLKAQLEKQAEKELALSEMSEEVVCLKAQLEKQAEKELALSEMREEVVCLKAQLEKQAEKELALSEMSEEVVCLKAQLEKQAEKTVQKPAEKLPAVPLAIGPHLPHLPHPPRKRPVSAAARLTHRVAVESKLTVTLKMDFARVEEAGREEFDFAFACSVGKSLGIEPERVIITSVTAGSVVVVMKVQGLTDAAARLARTGLDTEALTSINGGARVEFLIFSSH
jgi:hypothetical protein